MQVGRSVKVINPESLAYGRTGVVMTVGTKRNAGSVMIRFDDLPQLSESQRADPTKFTATFKQYELEVSPEKLPYDHTYTLYCRVGQQPMDQAQSTLCNPAMDSRFSPGEWNAMSREVQEQWLLNEAHLWAMDELIQLSWTR